MTPTNINEPTEAELEILQVLWEHEPATVRTVYEQLVTKRGVQYTTILKQMQRMLEKGMIKRKKKKGGHFYTTQVQEKEVQRSMFDRVVDTAFRGSAMKLFLHALGRSKIKEQELRALQEWLAQQNEEE